MATLRHYGAMRLELDETNEVAGVIGQSLGTRLVEGTNYNMSGRRALASGGKVMLYDRDAHGDFDTMHLFVEASVVPSPSTGEVVKLAALVDTFNATTGVPDGLNIKWLVLPNLRPGESRTLSNRVEYVATNNDLVGVDTDGFPEAWDSASHTILEGKIIKVAVMNDLAVAAIAKYGHTN